MKPILTLLPVFSYCLFLAPVGAAVLTVGPAGQDHTSVTAALGVAGKDDVIRVLAGTYSAASGEVFPLRLNKPLTLEWATTGAQPHLQGDSLHTVVSIETGGVTVRGFRITDGLGSEGINLMDGGGICVFVGPDETNTVHIENCVIEDNRCPRDETYDGSGGGIYCGGTYCECFQIHIRECIIRDNQVPGNGAGICGALLSIVVIEDTLIEDNVADDNGGGVFVDVYGFASLSRNTRLVKNQSIGDRTRANFGGKGGGLFCESFGFFVMTNCLVAGNTAVYYGGGIFTRARDRLGDDPCLPGARTPQVAATLLSTNWAGLDGGSAYLASSGRLIFRQSTHYWNDAQGDGGAVCVADSSSSALVQFTQDCVLEGNQCAGRGGGVYLGGTARGEFAATRFLGNSALLEGGAIFQQGNSSSVFTNCVLIYNNSARAYGGGLYLAPQATNELLRCTLVGNFAPFGRSAVCLNSNASATVVNSLLWRNAGGSIETNSGTVQMGFSLNDDPNPLFVGWGAKSNLYFNAVAPGPGSGTAADPYRDLQIGLDGFDFRLGTGSPCLGAASDGGNVGAATGTGGAPGYTVAAVNLGTGAYDIRGRNIIFTRGFQGNGWANSIIRNAVFGYMEDTFVRDLAITSERWFGGIITRANALFERCAIASNTVLTDGGGVYVAQGQCVVSDCLVSANQSVVNGGGVFLVTNTTLIADASVVLGNSNISPGTGNGGGVYGSAGIELLVTNNTLVANNGTPNDGGGIYLEAGTTAAVAGSEISENTANWGAGIYELGTLLMTDSRLVANDATLHAGGLHLGPAGTGTVARTSIALNSAGNTSGGILCWGTAWISSCGFLTNQALWAGALQVQNSPNMCPVLCEASVFLGNQAANNGGALRLWDNTAPVFDECEFVGNSANNGGAGNIWTGSHAVFSGCRFEGNRARTRGGALYLRATASSFRQCDFAANSAGVDGGAADIWSSDASVFERCTFTGETCDGSGGGLSIRQTATPSFRDVQIAQCRASVNGGAVACREQAAPRFEEVKISGSMAVLGGGVFADGTSVGTFERCQFLINLATNSIGSPDGGGANFTEGASGLFSCCAFDGNRALDDGGAISVSGTGANISLTNCFLLNNQAVNSGGGAHFTLDGAGVFQNCSIVSNRVQVSNGGGIYREASCPVALESSILHGNAPDGMAQAGGAVSVNYSCLQEVWPGTDNLLGDPLLNPLNFGLLAGSPCIDTGDPNLALEDGCLPPGMGTARNDMGASGGPGNCCQAGQNTLIHRYSFAVDARDSVGTAHGTLLGGPPVTAGSVHLNGVNQYVDLPGGLLNGLTSVTFEFWASFGTNGNWARVFDFGDRAGNNGNTYIFFTPHTSGGYHRLAVRDPSLTVYPIESPGTLDGLAQVHVACVFDPPTKRLLLYVNGMPVAWRTDVPSPLSDVKNIYSWLGRSLYLAYDYLTGSIDEFRIYNFALSPGEVWQSCQKGPDAPSPDGKNSGVLTLTCNVDRITLLWPDAVFPWDVVWSLYSSANLAPPMWLPVTNSVTRANGQVWVTFPTAEPHQFFRLHSP